MSVYKREWKDKQGKTHFCWYFHKTINGQRYRDRIPTARTRAQAEEGERKILAEIHEGTYGTRQRHTTFEEFATKVFLPWSEENRRSWKTDASRLKPLIAFFGKYRLAEITPFLIEKYKSDRRRSTTVRKTDKGEQKLRSFATINRELQLLYRIFQMAIANSEIATNPRAEVSLIKGENPRTRWLTPEEETKLFEKLTGPRAYLADLITLDLNTGLRKGELLNLKPEHIDFHRNLIRVTNTKTDQNREVFMNNTSRSILRRLVERSKAEGWTYLFTNPKTGTRYRDVKKGFRAALDDAGIEDFRFHDLRHTFATRAVDGDAPITALRDTLGHASIETTNRYAHSTEEGRRRVVEAQEKGTARPGHIQVTKEVREVKKRAV